MNNHPGADLHTMPKEPRRLSLYTRVLLWLMSVLMALPPSSVACVFNSCPTSAGGAGNQGSGPGLPPWFGRPIGSSPPPKGKEDPINLGRMSTYMWDTDVETAIVPGGKMDAALRFTRFQSSDDYTLTNTAVPAFGPLGIRWTHNYNIQLVTNGIGVKIKTEDASVETFTLDGASYASTAAGDTLLYKSGTNFVWQLRSGTKYTFDGTNNYRLLTIVDPLTNMLSLTYNGNSLLTNVADHIGRNLRISYNASNLISQVIDPLGRTNSFFYDDSNQLTNVVDAVGNKDVYSYDGPGSGRVTTITNPRGKTHSYVYDGVGKITSETNAIGSVMSFSRDDVAHLVTTTDRNGNNYTDSFNVDSIQTERTDSAGTMTVLRDERNRPTNVINRLGYLTQNFYATNGCGCEIAGGLVMSIDPLTRTNRWEIETNYNNPVTFTNALGNITRWKYDARGHLTNTTDALNKVTTQVYDAFGNLTKIIDANNATNTLAWDQYGNLTNRVDALGNAIRFKYDVMGRMTNSVDSLNRTNHLQYDVRNRIVRTINPLGGSIGGNYDGNNNLVALTNELGRVTAYGYDDADRLATITLPAGGGVFTSYAYDGNGNRIAETNALGNRTALGFDALNRMTSLTNALNKVWSFAYDAESRMTTSTDANSHGTTFGYDAANQLTSITNALSQVIQFQYDLAGNRTNIVDGRGNALGFRYDAVNRLTNLVYAASDSEKFAYDAVGNLTNLITRSGSSVAFAYDGANRLIRKGIAEFAYDGAGQLTNAFRPASYDGSFDSEVGFQFDAAGRLTNETQVIYSAPTFSGTVRSIGYQYNSAGRKTKMVYPDGTFVTYEYNGNGWLTAIKSGGTSSIVTYEYDAAGRRIKRTLENSTYTVLDYDSADQATNIWHRRVSGGTTNTLSRYAYGYDDAGNRKWVKRANGKGDVYKYDATDQLTNVLYGATNPDTTPTAATNEVRYVFDAAGNRTSVTSTNTGTTGYIANALNQYTNVGGSAVSYDANGNLKDVSAGTGDNDGDWVYHYGAENELTYAYIYFENSDWDAVYHVYDALGRLVARWNDISQIMARFYYDDQWRLIAEDDGDTNLTAKYVYGPEIDEPVRMTRNGTNYYYHAAALGTVTEITSSTGTLVEQYSYDVYGEPTFRNGSSNLLTGSAIGNRLLFQGRDRDPDTGLYNFRNRYYSPTMGRFLQVDPIGVRGGMNLYSFGANDPLNQTDPFGLSSYEAVVAAAEAAALAALPGGEFVAAFKVFDSCNTVGLALAWAKKEDNDCLADAMLGEASKCAEAEKECAKKWDSRISLLQGIYEKNCKGKK
jgi:RHS repeat-associated protein